MLDALLTRPWPGLVCGIPERIRRWQELRLGLEPSLPRLERGVSPWRRGGPACSATIGWGLPGWGKTLQSSNSTLTVRTSLGDSSSSHPSRTSRRRAGSSTGRPRDHGEPVRRPPGLGNPGGPWGAEMAVTVPWKPGILGGRGSECPEDAERPGAEPGVWDRAAQQWGCQRRQGRKWESSWGGTTGAGQGQDSTV